MSIHNKAIKKDLQNFYDHIHHFHILASDCKEGEKRGLLLGASPEFIDAIQLGGELYDGSNLNKTEKEILENLKNADSDYLDKVAQDGSGFGKTALNNILKGVGRTALKLAPVILPMLL